MKELTAAEKERRDALLNDIAFHKERINKSARLIQMSLMDRGMTEEHTEFTVRFSELMEYLHRMVEKVEKEVEL
jgi:hypothetical protein